MKLSHLDDHDPLATAEGIAAGVMTGVNVLIWGLVLLLLAGCATTLHRPDTGATVTCRQGIAWGGGSGPWGLAFASLGLALNLTYAVEQHDCISQAKRAGYVLPEAERPSEAIQGGMSPAGT